MHSRKVETLLSQGRSIWAVAALTLLSALFIFLIQRTKLFADQERQVFQAIQEHVLEQESEVSKALLNRDFFAELVKSLQTGRLASNALLQDLAVLNAKPFTIYLYDGDSLLYWNKPGMIMDPGYIRASAFPIIASDHREDYLLKKYELYDAGKPYRAFAKIPVLPGALKDNQVSVSRIDERMELIADDPSVLMTSENIPVGKLSRIAYQLSPLKQSLLCILYLIFGFGLVLLLKHLSRNVIGVSNRLAGIMACCSIVVLRILSHLTEYHKLFDQVSLLEPINSSTFFSYALGDLLVDSALVLWILALLGQPKKDSHQKKKSDRIVQSGTTIGLYTIFILTAGLFSWVQRWLLVDSGLDIDLERISFFNSRYFLVFFATGAMALSLFAIGARIIRQIIAMSPGIYRRLGHLVVASLISLPALSLLELNLSFFGYYLALLSFIILLDLFIENGSRTVIWVLCWLLLLSGFSAIQLFKFHLDKEVKQRSEIAISLARDVIGKNSVDQAVLDWLPELPGKYSLGIYLDQRLVYAYNHHYSPIASEVFEAEANGIVDWVTGDRSELVYKTANSLIQVGKYQDGLTGVVSLFSYLFTVFCIFLFGISIGNTLFGFLPKEVDLSFSIRPSLKSRIQLAIVFLLILSFVIIGFVTVFYLRNSSADQDKKIFDESLKTVATSLAQAVPGGSGPGDINNVLPRIANIAYSYNQRSRIYNAQGELILQQNAFDTGLGMPAIKMSFISKMLLDLSSVNYRTEELVNAAGDLGIKGVVAVTAGSGTLGYVEMPGLTMTNAEDAGSRFFGTLLNAYVFLFLIAVALAIAIANSITRPLSELGNKLKLLKLGKKNEPIPWGTDDEIGTLINNYNGMIRKLDDSAQLLAMTERDLAWREMAKQVAHEIKNPLTPMKLSIQYLQNAITTGQVNVKELVNRVSSTLIEQIENLATIASEFSSFAKMPQTHNEKVILNDIVASVHDLFRKRDDMDVNLVVPIQDIFVFADRNQLIRVLNNILKNATQAIPDDRRGRIDIELKKHEGMAIIKIRDNGSGISDEMRDKVFYPNFTTKTSGTGLGLAISANIVETFNGKLYFETEAGEGTCFFIEIPMMKLEDNFKEERRVSLG